MISSENLNILHHSQQFERKQLPEDLNLVGAKICSVGDLYTARQTMSHLSITGLAPRPSVQVMIRALRLLIQVVDESEGICDGDLVLSGFSTRGIAQCRCCRRCRFSRGLRHLLIPEILILYGAGNCRTGGNCLLLYSLHLREGSRQLYMNVCQ